MTATTVDWIQIERAWFEAVCAAIVRTSHSNPNECFYAGAFWLLYGDYSSLLVPAFGMNSERYATGVRWDPPDWRWSILDEVQDCMRPLYERLRELALDDAAYEAVWEKHIDMLARVSRRVTEVVRRADRWPTSITESSSSAVIKILRLSTSATNIAFWEWSATPPRSSVLPAMAAALGVRVEDLIIDPARPRGARSTARRRHAGPTGKLQQVFERAATLPRRQRQKLIEIVDSLVDQYSRKAG